MQCPGKLSKLYYYRPERAEGLEVELMRCCKQLGHGTLGHGRRFKHGAGV
jgi:hypothetical protein